MEKAIDAAAELAAANGDRQAMWRSLRAKGHSNSAIMSAVRHAASTSSSSSTTTTSVGSAAAEEEDGEEAAAAAAEDPSVAALQEQLRSSKTSTLDAGLKVRGLNPLMFATSAYDEPLALAVLKKMTESPSTSPPWLSDAGDYGYTPLHFACESGAAAVAAAILSAASRTDEAPAGGKPQRRRKTGRKSSAGAGAGAGAGAAGAAGAAGRANAPPCCISKLLLPNRIWSLNVDNSADLIWRVSLTSSKQANKLDLFFSLNKCLNNSSIILKLLFGSAAARVWSYSFDR